MADSFIRIPPDGIGKKVRTYERTVGTDDVHEHFMQVVDADSGDPFGWLWPFPTVPVDASGNEVVITSSDPGATDLGMVVRNIPSGTQTVDGTVSVTGEVETISANASNALYGAVTISTTAAVIRSSDSSRKKVVITNNGAGTLYVGTDGSVTTSGATMGVMVSPGGSMEIDSTWTGAIYGIYSIAASSQNVAYLQFGWSA